MADLVAVLSADTSQLQKSLNDAKSVLNKYRDENKKTGKDIEKTTGVTRQQADAFSKSVTALNKVNNSSKTAQQQAKGLEKQIVELSVQYSALSNTARSSDFGRAMATSIQQAQKRLQELQGTMSKVRTELNATSTKGLDLKNIKGQIGQLSTGLTALGVQGGSSLSSLASMGTALANPYVLAGAAITGAGVALFQYNKNLETTLHRTEQITGLSGNALASLRNGIKSVADTWDKDYNDVLGTVDVLMSQFGIDGEKALNIVRDGLVSGADDGGKLFDMISQYSGAFNDAGISASELVAIIGNTRSGIFSEEGMQAIQMGAKNIRTFSTSVQESLKGIGIDADDMYQKLQDGSISTIDAIKTISTHLKGLSPQSKEVGDVLQDVFGKKGTSAGYELISSLADVETELEKVKKQTGAEGEALEDLQKADRDLENAMMSLFGISNSGFSTLTTTLKTEVYKALTDVINKFVELYNKSTLVRGAIASIALQYKQSWAIIKAVCKQFAIALEGIADAVEDILTGNWDKVGDDIGKTIEATGKNLTDLGNELIGNIQDAFNTTINGHIDVITTETESTTSKPTKGTTVKPSGSTSGGKSGNSAKGGKSKVEVEPVVGSLDYLNKQLSVASKKLSSQLFDKGETESSVKDQVDALKKQIEAEEIRLGIKPDTDKQQLEKNLEQATKQADKAFTDLEDKEYHPVFSPVVRANQNPSKEDVFNSNNQQIEQNNQQLAKLDQQIQKVAESYYQLVNATTALSGANWTDEQTQEIDKLESALSGLQTQYQNLEDQQKKLIATNQKLNKELSNTDMQKAAKDGYDGFKNTTKAVFGTVDAIKDLAEGWDEMDDWEKFESLTETIYSTIDGFTSLYDSINGLISIFQMFSTASTTAQAVQNANTQQAIANNTAQVASDSAVSIAEATKNGASMPFPANIAAIAAGIAAVVAAFAMIGSFADGGIIGGATTLNDMNLARVNKGEMLLNGTQQAKLFHLLNGTGGIVGKSGLDGKVEFEIKGTQLKGVLNNHTRKVNKLL